MLSYAVDFKLKLEKLLADMVIVSEIADLAAEANKLKDEIPTDEKNNVKKDVVFNVPKPGSNKKGLPVWSKVDFEKAHGSDDEEEDSTASKESPEIKITKSSNPRLSRSPSGSVRFKSRLEKWNEPTTHDKVNQIRLVCHTDQKDEISAQIFVSFSQSGEVTIQDVLKFKHALNYLDNDDPFGNSFGKVSDRNDSIECSHRIYYELLKCSPESEDIPFEVLSWITFDEYDNQDIAKLKALRRLFHPDARGNLPLFAFVQVSISSECPAQGHCAVSLHKLFANQIICLSAPRAAIRCTNVTDSSRLP